MNDRQRIDSLWNPDLIARYDLSGPRYTSYPTAPQFRADFGPEALAAQLALGNRRGNPLSLYVHIPFCSRVCYFCGCNKIVTANRNLAGPYLARLEREMAMTATLVDAARPVEQLHWGGGTPTYISDQEKHQLMASIRRHFSLRDDDRGEYAVEVHPGDTSAASIACLRALGFNRLSMGVQDFDDQVQRAVNRFNSVAEVRDLVNEARRQGFHSISMDLIYGLPLQDWRRFEPTLDAVIELAPDRLSLFSYAHMPHLFKTQRQIDPSQLPAPAVKLDMLHNSIGRLLDAGYVYIGMDHFARPDDELAVAQRERRLHRNFQGYATHGDCDLLAFGVSAISRIGDSFCQNPKTLGDYQAAIEGGRLPVARGIVLNDDDRVRAAVIQELVCHFGVNFLAIERRFGIRFADYFAAELDQLTPLVADGLVRIAGRGIEVTAAGRLLVRRVCMVFDAWLGRTADNSSRYSRII